MKLFYVLIILIFFQNCSFDNKTGIWKNENIKIKKNDDIFKEFKKISKSSDAFNKIIHVKKNFTFRIVWSFRKTTFKNFIAIWL